MLESLAEYYEYIILIFVFIAVVLGIWIIIYIRRMSKYFLSQKYRVITSHEINPLSDKEDFKITIFNNNINDSRLVAIGIMYKTLSINYLQDYLNQNKLGAEAKILIQTRDSITLKIGCIELAETVKNLDEFQKVPFRTTVYAVDSLGKITKSKSRAISKKITQIIKNIIQDEKNQELTSLQEKREDMRLEKAKKLAEEKEKFQAQKELERKQKAIDYQEKAKLNANYKAIKEKRNNELRLKKEEEKAKLAEAIQNGEKEPKKLSKEGIKKTIEEIRNKIEK